MSGRATFAFHQQRVHAVAQGNRWRFICVHEAGHAIVDRALGMAVTEISIGFDSDGGQTGETVSRQFTRTLSALDRLTSLAAGAIAESKVHDGPVYDAGDLDDSYDIALGEHRDIRDAWAMIERARRRADEILSANWGTVCRLADALASRCRMTTEEIAPYVCDVAPVTELATPSLPSPSPARSRPTETAPLSGPDLWTRSAAPQILQVRGAGGELFTTRIAAARAV